MRASLFRALVLLTILPSVLASEASGKLLIVVNKRASIKSVSAADLQAMFLGSKTTWADGSRVLAALSETATHDPAFEGAIGRDRAGFRKFWHVRLFSGRALPPMTFSSLDDLLRYISENDGAIGLIPETTLPLDVISLQLVP